MSSIKPSISDSYAEYLRIQIMRSTDQEEVDKLRSELEDVLTKLYKQHKQMIARTRKC